MGPPGRHADDDLYLFVGGRYVAQVGEKRERYTSGIEMYVYQDRRWRLAWQSRGPRWQGLSSLTWWGGI